MVQIGAYHKYHCPVNMVPLQLVSGYFAQIDKKTTLLLGMADDDDEISILPVCTVAERTTPETNWTYNFAIIVHILPSAK